MGKREIRRISIGNEVVLTDSIEYFCILIVKCWFLNGGKGISQVF